MPNADEVIEDVVLDEAPADQADPPQDEPGADPAADAQPEAVTVSLGEDADADASDDAAGTAQWVKDLRKRNRENERELKQLRAERAAAQKPSDALGPRPALADDGINFDEEVFAEKLAAWQMRKLDIDRRAADQQAAADKQAEAWKQTLAGYETEKAEFRKQYPAIDDAEETIRDSLSAQQQSILVHALKSRAPMIAGLAASPKKLKELSEIQDPIMFTAELVRLESKMSVNARKPATSPEIPVRPASPGATLPVKQIEQLREKAGKTGDYTAYYAAKAAQREKAR